MTENARPGSWWGSIAWAWRTPGKSDALKMMHFVLKIIHDVLKMMHFVSKMMHFIFKMMNLVVQLQNIPGNHVVPGLRVHVSHLNPPFLVFQSHLARPLQRWTFAFESSFLTQCDLGRVFWIQNSSFICKKWFILKHKSLPRGVLCEKTSLMEDSYIFNRKIRTSQSKVKGKSHLMDAPVSLPGGGSTQGGLDTMWFVGST